MIFATCGSSPFRFDRMIEALAALPAASLHVQHGPADPPCCAAAYPDLTFAALIEELRTADVVISHAGVGSILCAVHAGHTPIVFPRLKRYSEHVDDHQVELAEALAERGVVVIAHNGDELVSAIDVLPPRRPAIGGAPGEFVAPGEPVAAGKLAEAVRTTISVPRAAATTA